MTHASAKLTEEQVLWIHRQDYKVWGRQKQVAAELGVTSSAVHYIRKGQNWRYIWGRLKRATLDPLDKVGRQMYSD